MILVTGGFGFIGSNIISNLNQRGHSNIVVVDDLEDGRKFKNLADKNIKDYYDVDEFFDSFPEHEWEKITGIYHEGAISSTTEWNGKLVMERNYKFSCKILDKALKYEIPLSYASSASVYGDSTEFFEDGKLNPLNVYGYSKTLFDRKVEDIISTDWYQNSPHIIQGYRYFNVYGKGEDHKDDQASPVHKFMKQANETGEIKVFEGSENFRRDFVCAEDISILKIEMIQRNISGIFNAGTGKPVSFMDVADAVARKTGAKITIIPFPDHLKGHYQEYTCANLTKLGSVGCPIMFRNITDYIREM